MKKLIFMGCALLSAGLVLGSDSRQTAGSSTTRLRATNRFGSKNLDIKVNAEVMAVIEIDATGFQEDGKSEIQLIGTDGKKTAEGQRKKILTPRIQTGTSFAEVKIESDFIAYNEKDKDSKIPYFVKMINHQPKTPELQEIRESKTFQKITVQDQKPIELIFDFDDNILTRNSDIKCGKYTSHFKIILTPAV